MKNFFQKLKFAIFKPQLKCICCGSELICPEGHSLCKKCLESLPIINKPCLKCGMQMKEANQFCTRCKSTKHKFKKCISVCDYNGNVKTIIYKFKYNGNKFLSRPLAFLLAEKFKQSKIETDVAVCVPLCEKRLKTRGYNQSELLAKEFCALCNVPLSLGNLIRIKETESQTEKGFAARQLNLKDAFKVQDKREFKNKTVLAIDDVITTGATLNECAAALLKAGAKEVFCITIANTKSKIKFEKTVEK